MYLFVHYTVPLPFALRLALGGKVADIKAAATPGGGNSWARPLAVLSKGFPTADRINPASPDACTYMYAHIHTHTHVIHFPSQWENLQFCVLECSWISRNHGFKFHFPLQVCFPPACGLLRGLQIPSKEIWVIP